MVQTTDFTDGDNLAQLRRLDRPPVRRILSETLASPTQKSRSVVRGLGRVVVRL